MYALEWFLGVNENFCNHLNFSIDHSMNSQTFFCKPLNNYLTNCVEHILFSHGFPQEGTIRLTILVG